MLKCTKFDVGAGGAYSAPPDPQLASRGPTSRGREGVLLLRGGEGRRGEGNGHY